MRTFRLQHRLSEICRKVLAGKASESVRQSNIVGVLATPVQWTLHTAGSSSLRDPRFVISEAGTAKYSHAPEEVGPAMMACDANMHGACGTCKHRAVVSIAG